MLSLFDSSIDHTRRAHSPPWHPTLTLVSPSFRFDLCGLEPFSDMALVDFHQLAALYKLGRADPGFPICSRPPCMSVASPPRSPSPSVEPDEARPSLPPSTKPQPKTPERVWGAARPTPDITPQSLGSSVRQRQEGDTDRVDNYDRDDYEEYIREDLKNRVFVDYEVFMEYVLRVPHDWRTEWKSVIEATKSAPEFKSYHEEYCKYCKNPTTLEVAFYEPLAKTANAVLDVLSRSGLDGLDNGIPQSYHINNPRKLQGGVFNKSNLSPDLVVLHKEYDTAKPNSLHWANALHVLEVKPHDNAICDGEHMPRLVVGGEHATNLSCI